MDIGDKVVKDEENWIANAFDSWGRGVGIGIIVKSPHKLDEDEVDVKWPNGRCFEYKNQLKIVKI